MSLVVFFVSALLILGGIGITLNRKVKKYVERSFSIVVVAKNEEMRIAPLLNSLDYIDYPTNLFEIILVDDCSTDNTNMMLNQFASKHANATVISLNENEKTLPGKKEGLQRALEIAKMEIMLLTDADCAVNQNWLKDINRYWSDDTVLLVGYAPEELESTKHKYCYKYSFRRFSQLATSGVFAATIGLGIPFSCYGRNLAISRSKLIEAGGYKGLNKEIAGDDKQVLNLIKKQNGAIRYSPVKNVVSQVLKEGFHEQQKRRFGKVKQSSLLYIISTMLLLLFLLIIPFWVVLSRNYQVILTLFLSALVAWCLNLLVHRERFALTDPLYIVIYPYFMLYYTILGSVGGWKWKD